MTRRTPPPPSVPVGSHGTTAVQRVRLAADVRRDQILAAAALLFAERPYASVSTSDLAEAAGTTRTNVHYYFGTKRGLYLEVIQQFGQVAELPPAGTGRATGPAELDRLFARWLDVLEQHPQMILMLIGAMTPGADPEVADAFHGGLRAWEDRLLAVLELPDEPSTRAMIRSFQGLVSVAVTEWLDARTLTKGQVHMLITRTLVTVAMGLAARSESS